MYQLEPIQGPSGSGLYLLQALGVIVVRIWGWLGRTAGTARLSPPWWRWQTGGGWRPRCGVSPSASRSGSVSRRAHVELDRASITANVWPWLLTNQRRSPRPDLAQLGVGVLELLLLASTAAESIRPRRGCRHRDRRDRGRAACRSAALARSGGRVLGPYVPRARINARRIEVSRIEEDGVHASGLPTVDAGRGLESVELRGKDLADQHPAAAAS